MLKKNMWDKAFDLIKWTVELFGRERVEGRENLKHISEVILEISEVVADTVEKMKRDEYPHQNCGILMMHSQNLCNLLEDSIDEKILAQLKEVLDQASQIEIMFSKRAEPGLINSLEEISGKLKAFSIHIKL
jgi:hypothetical protein